MYFDLISFCSVGSALSFAAIRQRPVLAREHLRGRQRPQQHHSSRAFYQTTLICLRSTRCSLRRQEGEMKESRLLD